MINLMPETSHAKMETALQQRAMLSLRCGLGFIPKGQNMGINWSFYSSFAQNPRIWKLLHIPLEKLRIPDPEQRDKYDYCYFETFEHTGLHYGAFVLLSAEDQVLSEQLFQGGEELSPTQDLNQAVLQAGAAAIDRTLEELGLPLDGERVWVGSVPDRLNAIGGMTEQKRDAEALGHSEEALIYGRTAELLKGETQPGSSVVVVMDDPLVRLELVYQDNGLKVVFASTLAL